MKTKKCKVAVYDCKKHKVEILEKELPVFEPPKPTPSPLETALYHLCKLIDPPNDRVLDEFVKMYESTYGETYKPTVKFVTESELNKLNNKLNSLSNLSSEISELNQKLNSLAEISSEVSMVPISGSKSGQLSTSSANTLSFSMLNIPAGIMSANINANLQMTSPKGKTCGCEIILSGSIIKNTRIGNTAKTIKISSKFAAIRDCSLIFKFTAPPPYWDNWNIKYNVSVEGKVLTVG